MDPKKGPQAIVNTVYIELPNLFPITRMFVFFFTETQKEKTIFCVKIEL